jgi:cytochrome c oxidase cbb3-type subunit 3
MAEQPQKIDPIQGAIVHEYDGIEEADNQLPRWWVAAFIGTIAFALAYWLGFEVFDARPTPYAEYVAQAKAIDAAREVELAATPSVNTEQLEQLADQVAVVAQGASVYAAHCVPCHGAKAEGKIGPNLTDAAWLHGGGPLAIHGTIANGILAKGMPAWGPLLGPKALREVTAYVLSLRNSNVPGGKAAEGATDPAKQSAL